MNNGMRKRIQDRLTALGISAADASKKAGMGKDFIRDMMRKDTRPGADSLSRLAKTLKTSPDYLLYGEDSPPRLEVEGLPVVGVIEAGQFRDITLVSQDQDFPVVNVVPDPRYRHARQYALRVSGDSMNEMFEDGSYVICAEWGDVGLPLKDGFVLHVERMIAGTHLVETTLKEVRSRNGARYLAPRSTNSRHKPIEIGDDDDMTEMKVRGLVIGSFKPHTYG